MGWLGVSPRRPLKIDRIFLATFARGQAEPSSKQIELSKATLEHQPSWRTVVAEVDPEPRQVSDYIFDPSRPFFNGLLI